MYNLECCIVRCKFYLLFNLGVFLSDSDVIVMTMDKRKPAQGYVSVCAPSKPAVLADPVIKPHFASDETRLMILCFFSFNAEHFLEGDDVCIDLPEDLRDSPNLNPLIKTASLVDVVGRDS